MTREGREWNPQDKDILQTVRVEYEDESPESPPAIVTRSMLVEVNTGYSHASLVLLNELNHPHSMVTMSVDASGAPCISICMEMGDSDIARFLLIDGKWQQQEILTTATN